MMSLSYTYITYYAYVIQVYVNLEIISQSFPLVL